MADVLPPRPTKEIFSDALTAVLECFTNDAMTVKRLQSAIGGAIKADKTQEMTPDDKSRLAEIAQCTLNLIQHHQFINDVSAVQSLVRRHFAMREYEKLLSRYNKERVNVFLELVRGESEYTKSLNFIVHNFMIPLFNSNDKELVVEGEDLKGILSAISDLEALHRSFFRQLKGFHDQLDWPCVDGLGKLFLDNASQFLAYGKYVENFKYAIDVITSLEDGLRRPKLVRMINEKITSQGQDLGMLLTKPLNRMTSYELSLSKMVDLTSTEDKDFSLLVAAQTQMNETNKSIRTSLAKAQKNSRIIKYIKKVSTNKFDITFLMDGEHDFVREGFIEIHKRQGLKKRSPGILQLYSDSILVSSMSRGHYTLKRVYMLNKTRIEEQENGALSLCALSKEIDADADGPSSSSSSLASAPAASSGSSDSLEVSSSRLKILCASPGDAKDWIREFQKIREQNQTSRVFAVPLALLITRETHLVPSRVEEEKSVPLLIVKLFKHIIENGIETVGVFRIPGSAAKEKELRQHCNKSGVVALNPESAGISAHDAAGLIKLFFRELPGTCCGQQFEVLVNIARNITGVEETIAALQSVMMEIPEVNRRTIAFTCRAMYKIGQHHEANKMDIPNLAMCIGPDLMRPARDSLELALQIPTVNGALANMIKYHDRIFNF